MIFVDTSIWVDALQGIGQISSRLSNLLDADEVAIAFPVRIELLSGASSKDIRQLQRVLSALPTFFPTNATWKTMEAWTLQASAKGHRFGMADLLIAAVAGEYGGKLWSLDADFQRMERLGFVERFRSTER